MSDMIQTLEQYFSELFMCLVSPITLANVGHSCIPHTQDLIKSVHM